MGGLAFFVAPSIFHRVSPKELHTITHNPKDSLNQKGEEEEEEELPHIIISLGDIPESKASSSIIGSPSSRRICLLNAAMPLTVRKIKFLFSDSISLLHTHK